MGVHQLDPNGRSTVSAGCEPVVIPTLGETVGLLEGSAGRLRLDGRGERLDWSGSQDGATRVARIRSNFAVQGSGRVDQSTKLGGRKIYLSGRSVSP